MVKVSVIVPIYNVEKYLEDCIKSLLNQTMKDFEVILVNDGSTDGSQEIIDKFVNDYEFINGYKKENGGQSDARNYGFMKANGEYVMFLDADDWLDNKTLEMMYDSAKKDDSDIVICDIEEIYEDGRKIVRKEIDDKIDNINKAYMIALPGFCDKLFKRKFLEENNFKFPNGMLYEDLAIYPYIASKANKVSYVSEAFYKYRIRLGSTMNQENAKKLADIFKVFEIIDENMKNNKDDFDQELEYIYIKHLLHAASLRFLDYKSEDENVYKVADIMKEKYPNWRKNIYYKSEGLKYKVVCELIYRKKINLLRKILKKNTVEELNGK